MDCTCPQPKNLQYLCQHKSPNRGRALRPYDFDEPGEQQSSNKTQHEMSPDRDPTSRHSAPFSCRVPRPRTGTRRPERKRTKELGVRLLESISFSLVSVFSFLEDLEQGGSYIQDAAPKAKKIAAPRSTNPTTSSSSIASGLVSASAEAAFRRHLLSPMLLVLGPRGVYLFHGSTLQGTGCRI